MSPKNFLHSLGVLGGSNLCIALTLGLIGVMQGILSLINNV